MVNNIIDSEKMNQAALVYNPCTINQISNLDIHMRILFLEVLLLKIRGETIKFASRLKKENTNLKNNLEKEIEQLEATCDATNINKLISKKEALVKLRAIEQEASKVRSRATWLKDGEKPSKFLSSLENKGYIDKTIKRLQKSDGQYISNQEEILNEVQIFYKRLFSPPQNECEPQLKRIMNNLETAKLSSVEAMGLEHELSVEEISQALKQMKNGKSPGIDGYPAEIFKIFWKKLKFFVPKAYNWSYTKGEMSISLWQCLISCIPKATNLEYFLRTGDQFPFYLVSTKFYHQQ